MGSEENYLDNLLKSMENGAGASGRAPIIGDSVSYDDVATLTEDEMEKMILNLSVIPYLNRLIP